MGTDPDLHAIQRQGREEFVSWNCNRVSLRMVSPIHVGWRSFGNVKTTRPYVTGRALWGALTARLARDYPSLGGYQEAGDRVQQDLAFSYFYPSVSADVVNQWPWDWFAFSSRFLGSYASTALADGRSKEDGSLHETEFIMPNASGDPVFLNGYVFERSGAGLPWRGTLGDMQLGGERGYGWGRVAAGGPPIGCDSVFGMAVKLDGERPVVQWQPEAAATAHVRGDAPWHVDGAVEPLVGRITNPARGVPGVEHSSAVVCWIPGSKLREADGVECAIGPHGVWMLPAGT